MFPKNISKSRNVVQKKQVTIVEKKDKDVILAILVTLQNSEVKKKLQKKQQNQW